MEFFTYLSPSLSLSHCALIITSLSLYSSCFEREINCTAATVVLFFYLFANDCSFLSLFHDSSAR